MGKPLTLDINRETGKFKKAAGGLHRAYVADESTSRHASGNGTHIGLMSQTFLGGRAVGETNEKTRLALKAAGVIR